MATQRADLGPYDLDAILKDYRNWRGVDRQKDQALLWQILDQSHRPERVKGQHVPPPKDGMKVIFLATIEKYTGIKRETVVPLLEGLQDRGFIRYDVEHNERRTIYRAKVRDRNIGNWPIKYKHRKPIPNPSVCPF